MRKCILDTSTHKRNPLNTVLLLLLNHFSRFQLYATPKTASYQAPLSLGFSRQEQEWVAISFSNAGKWKVKVKSLSRVWLVATSWTAVYQAPPSMEFSRQEYWSGVPLPSPKDSASYCQTRITEWTVRGLKTQSTCGFRKIWTSETCSSLWADPVSAQHPTTEVKPEGTYTIQQGLP